MARRVQRPQVRVRDVKGTSDLAVLLGRPHTEVHALELMGARDVGGSAGPVLDERARRAYQQRIVELQREIDEAHVANDPARADRAMSSSTPWSSSSVRPSGSVGVRPLAPSAERARTAVTYRIRSAIRKVANVQPELGRHLSNSVRTGTWCCTSRRPT